MEARAERTSKKVCSPFAPRSEDRASAVSKCPGRNPIPELSNLEGWGQGENATLDRNGYEWLTNPGA